MPSLTGRRCPSHAISCPTSPRLAHGAAIGMTMSACWSRSGASGSSILPGLGSISGARIQQRPPQPLRHAARWRLLELIATVPGKSSATLDRLLARGPGAHILALEVDDHVAALERLHRAGITGDASLTGVMRTSQAPKYEFALVLPPDPPEGRMLLIRI